MPTNINAFPISAKNPSELLIASGEVDRVLAVRNGRLVQAGVGQLPAMVDTTQYFEYYGAVGDGADETPTDDADALEDAINSGSRYLRGMPGKTYYFNRDLTFDGVTDLVIDLTGCTIRKGPDVKGGWHFNDHDSVIIYGGGNGLWRDNYTAAGAWESLSTTGGFTSSDKTGTAGASYTSGSTNTITINGLGTGYVKKGVRLSYIVAGTTYSHIVQADVAIVAGTATGVVLDRNVAANITSGQAIYCNEWSRRMVLASAYTAGDATITLECGDVTSAAGTPRILAGDQFCPYGNYNDITDVNYAVVAEAAANASFSGSYPAKTVTITLVEPLDVSLPLGTMITSIQDHRNNRFAPILFFGGANSGVIGMKMTDARVHGFVANACITAPWNGVDPSTKPNSNMVFADNHDSTANGVGAFIVGAWTSNMEVRNNSGVYDLGDLRSLCQIERSTMFAVDSNYIYGGQYLANINGECADGKIVHNRGSYMRRMVRQGNTSKRILIAKNSGVMSATYSDYGVLVTAGALDEDEADTGSTLRINDTIVSENQFSGRTRTAGGYGSHIMVGPQNLDTAATSDSWPRAVRIIGNTCTQPSVYGIYVLLGDNVEVENNTVLSAGTAGIWGRGGTDNTIVGNTVIDAGEITPTAGVVLYAGDRWTLAENRTLVSTGTGMAQGLDLQSSPVILIEHDNDWNGGTTSGGLSQMAMQSRAGLEALATYGLEPQDGQVAQAGDLFYVGTTGATELPDLPGWLPYGAVRPEHGGTGTDLASHQAAQDAAAITGAPILISQAAVLSGAITEGSNYRLRETTNQIAWASTTDVSRALPGLADASLANSYPRIFNWQDASGGSAGSVFVSFRAKASSSVASFEKDGLMVIARSEDPSEGTDNGGVGTSINRDVVGLGGRAYVHAGNMSGRVWGMNAYARVSTGSQGRACGIEVDVDNQISDAVTDMDAPFLKQGVHIVSKSGLVGVGAQINSGGADGFARGFVVRSAAINATHGISAFEYQGKWRVDKDGNEYLGKATGAETEAGVALLQAGDAVITKSAGIASLKTVRASAMGAAGAVANLDADAQTSAGTQRNIGRMQWYLTTHTDGAEVSELRFSAMNAGTLGQRAAIGNGMIVGGATLVMKGAGTINAATAYYANDTKVVGTRKTGWTVATGTATRTAFDTATVTTAQLAERVKALIDDLHGTAGHGLIGT